MVFSCSICGTNQSSLQSIHRFPTLCDCLWKSLARVFAQVPLIPCLPSSAVTTMRRVTPSCSIAFKPSTRIVAIRKAQKKRDRQTRKRQVEAAMRAFSRIDRVRSTGISIDFDSLLFFKPMPVEMNGCSIATYQYCDNVRITRRTKLNPGPGELPDQYTLSWSGPESSFPFRRIVTRTVNEMIQFLCVNDNLIECTCEPCKSLVKAREHMQGDLSARWLTLDSMPHMPTFPLCECIEAYVDWKRSEFSMLFQRMEETTSWKLRYSPHSSAFHTRCENLADCVTCGVIAGINFIPSVVATLDSAFLRLRGFQRQFCICNQRSVV